MLGLGLTALLASFMSGMAGNVTAFNTVWTYDIYHAYIYRRGSDQHYLVDGADATIFGVAISVAAAYTATKFNNIMDMLQVVFGLANAPLLATLLLGMFWKRTTGLGAFFGLVAGTAAGLLHNGLTLPKGAVSGGMKGGWIDRPDAPRVLHTYPSEMAQNFWTAIFAFARLVLWSPLSSACLLGPREESELSGPRVFADRTSERFRQGVVLPAGDAGHSSC